MSFLKKWVDKHSNKSETEKRGIALLYSSVITIFIFVIWVITMMGTNLNSEEAIVKPKTQVASPSESLISQVKDLFSGTRTYTID
jgi:hypothetical protein